MGRHAAYHYVADDHQRGLLLLHAIRKGMEQERGDFYYALLADGLDDKGLTLWWRGQERLSPPDYVRLSPHFAEKLFLHGYRAAYRRHLQDVASGRHTDPVALARAIDLESGLAEPLTRRLR